MVTTAPSDGYAITIRRDGEPVAEIEQLANGWTLRVRPDLVVFCLSATDALEQFYAYTQGK